MSHSFSGFKGLGSQLSAYIIHSSPLSLSLHLPLCDPPPPSHPLSLHLPLPHGEDSPGMKRVSSAPNVRYCDSIDDEAILDAGAELVEAVLLRDKAKQKSSRIRICLGLFNNPLQTS